MIDLVKMKALVWPSDVDEKDLGATYNEEDIPENMVAEAEQYRSELMDVLSLIDEDLMERYLGDEDISVDDLKKVIRKGTLAGGDRSDPQRHGIQEQGCTAVTRRRHRLHAGSDRSASRCGHPSTHG